MIASGVHVITTNGANGSFKPLEDTDVSKAAPFLKLDRQQTANKEQKIGFYVNKKVRGVHCAVVRIKASAEGPGLLGASPRNSCSLVLWQACHTTQYLLETFLFCRGSSADGINPIDSAVLRICIRTQHSRVLCQCPMNNGMRSHQKTKSLH